MINKKTADFSAVLIFLKNIKKSCVKSVCMDLKCDFCRTFVLTNIKNLL